MCSFKKSLDLTPIFKGLFDQLEIRSRDGFAFGALLRHREVLGQNDFESYIEKMDERQRNTFRILSQSYEDRDFHLSKKRPREGVSFGMIPNAIINKLLDRQNRNMRAEGAVMLMQELEQAATQHQKMDLLLPYMGSFIRFLGNLLLDASPKVSYARAQFLTARISLFSKQKQNMAAVLNYRSFFTFWNVMTFYYKMHQRLSNNIWFKLCIICLKSAWIPRCRSKLNCSS